MYSTIPTYVINNNLTFGWGSTNQVTVCFSRIECYFILYLYLIEIIFLKYHITNNKNVNSEQFGYEDKILSLLDTTNK